MDKTFLAGRQDGVKSANLESRGRRLIPSHVFLLGCCLALAACQSEPKRLPVNTDSTSWQPSTLSEQTIARANGAIRQYERCLNSEALGGVKHRGDPRGLADRILRACEGHLEGIRAAYSAEGVPDAISERYMRKTRSRGAQSLMRFLQAVEAQRDAEEVEMQTPSNQKN